MVPILVTGIIKEADNVLLIDITFIVISQNFSWYTYLSVSNCTNSNVHYKVANFIFIKYRTNINNQWYRNVDIGIIDIRICMVVPFVPGNIL